MEKKDDARKDALVGRPAVAGITAAYINFLGL